MEQSIENPVESAAEEDTLSKRTLDYFSVEVDAQNIEKHRCNLCDKLLVGKHTPNLTKHLRISHKNLKDVQEHLSKRSTESFAIKRLKLLQACTEIVTVNGRNFKHLLDSGFQSVIEERLNELKFAGCALNIKDTNLKVIKDYIPKVADEVRQIIANDVSKRLLSMMVDIGTKNSRAFLGISIQFWSNGELIIRSLGLIELHQSHTAKYITEVINNVLTEYSIELRQIVSITVDNGKNMVKMTTDINQIDDEIEVPNQDITQSNVIPNATEKDDVLTSPNEDTEFVHAGNEDNDGGDVIFCDEEIAAIAHDTVVNDYVNEDETEIKELFNAEAEYSNILKEALNGFSAEHASSILYISGIKCAAHTVQLVVKDSLSPPNSDILNICKHIAKCLRQSSFKQELTQQKIAFTTVRLSCPTRWSSQYIMVNNY